MPSEVVRQTIRIKHLVLTFLKSFALIVSPLYTLLLIFKLMKQSLFNAVSLIIILMLIWFWRKGEVFHDYAAWLLLAWLVSIWAVSALLGVITIDFSRRQRGTCYCFPR